jgi:biopolymer transport protein ExbB
VDLVNAQLVARDRPTLDGSTPSKQGGASIRITTSDDDPDLATGPEGTIAPRRNNSSQSPLGWKSHVSTPVVVVTIVITAMSFYLIALVVWMALHYRTSATVPPALLHRVQELLDQSKYNEAFDRLLGDSSFLARVLVAGVRQLPEGLSHAQRVSDLANEDVRMQMEHSTAYLTTVGTLGPMIGLVGTVYGMIVAFRGIALDGSSPQASQLAAGISTALYSTLEGIAISIPAIYFYAMFRNRIARLSLEVEMVTARLLALFAPGVRPSEPRASPSPVPPSSAHRHPFAISAALAAAGASLMRPDRPSIE